MNCNRIIDQYAKVNEIKLEDLLNLRDFSDYEHQSFKDAADAKEFIEILSNQISTRKVVIDTDYDCDGVMSGIILEASLKRLGFNVSTYHPTEHDGYGLTISEADKILKQFPTVDLIVTADSGINCKEAVDYLYSKNVKVLVSDHHKGEIDRFPDKALVCVDVNRSDKQDDYQFKHISGAQTAYKLMMLYAEKYGTLEDITYIKSLRIFAAISVLSDVMLIDNENRELVKDLLDICNSDKLEKMSMTNEYVARFRQFLLRFGSGEVTCETFGFAVIPTINSNRRMTGESTLAFQLFDDSLVVRETAINMLMRLNDLRKSTKKIAQSQASLIVDEKFLKIAVVDVSQGILGLIASDYSNRHSCTSLVFRKSGEYLTASGRGRANLSIYELLRSVKETDPSLDFSFGGHSNALGCGVAVKDFDRFCEIARQKSNEIFNASMLEQNNTAIDSHLREILNDKDFADQTFQVCTLLKQLQPIPYYLNNLRFRILDLKENYLFYGFQNFGKEYEHLKFKSNETEIIGFFDFVEFYNSDLDDRFEMILAAKLEHNKLKYIIEKVRKLND